MAQISFWDKLKDTFGLSSSRKLLGDGSDELMNVEGIDEGVSEIVTLLNKNYMKPFASCDGMIKTHIDSDKNDITNGYIAMLDSKKGRDLIAILLDDYDYNISISKMEDCEIYGNKVSGIRLGIYFENAEGDKQNKLKETIEQYLQGKIKPDKKQRKRVEMVCDFIEANKSDDYFLEYDFKKIYKLSYKDKVRNNCYFKLSNNTGKKNLRGFELYSDTEKSFLNVRVNEIECLSYSFAESMRIFQKVVSYYKSLPERSNEDIMQAQKNFAALENMYFQQGIESNFENKMRTFWGKLYCLRRDSIEKYKKEHPERPKVAYYKEPKEEKISPNATPKRSRPSEEPKTFDPQLDGWGDIE